MAKQQKLIEGTKRKELDPKAKKKRRSVKALETTDTRALETDICSRCHHK